MIYVPEIVQDSRLVNIIGLPVVTGICRVIILDIIPLAVNRREYTQNRSVCLNKRKRDQIPACHQRDIEGIGHCKVPRIIQPMSKGVFSAYPAPDKLSWREPE